MKMRFTALLLIVLSFQLVYAESITLTATNFHTFIKARVANTGTEPVFLTMYEFPVKWDTIYYDYSKSMAYREEGLWRIYGENYEKSASESMKNVFTNKVPAPNTIITGGIQGLAGWWLRPNEMILIDVEFGASSGTKSAALPSTETTTSPIYYSPPTLVWDTTYSYIDFTDIERRNPSMKIFRWEQEFLFEIESSSSSSSAIVYMSAPFVIKGARLTSASIGLVGELRSIPSDLHLYNFRYAYSAPKWQEWYKIRNALPMNSAPLAATKYGYYPLLKPQLEIPVWRVLVPVNGTSIRYGYEWRRDGNYPFDSPGISLSSGIPRVPEWFNWF